MEEIPSVFELASLAATLSAYPRVDQNNKAREKTMNEALEIYRLAEKTVGKLKDSVVDARRIAEMRAQREKLERLVFAPHQETDQVREYLKEDDPGELPGGLPNLRKGSTVESKLKTYFTNRGVLMNHDNMRGEDSIWEFFSRQSVDSQGNISYALLKSELFRFKCWQREMRRIEALFRKSRASGSKPQLSLIMARLAAASTGNSMKAQEFEHIFTKVLDSDTVQIAARTIFKELLPLIER